MIIVDSREFRSKVVKHLFENNIDFQSLRLQVGDYLINEDICIERKSAKDFIDSLIDKRLFEQLNRMKREYKKPIIIIEGGDIFSVRKIHPNAIIGLIITIVIDYNIPILFSRDEKETAEYITSMERRSDKEPRAILKMEKKVNLKDVQESILQNIPYVGVKMSKSLLKKFKTIKNIFNASLKELEEVEGVGKKVAEEIFRISNKRYE